MPYSASLRESFFPGRGTTTTTTTNDERSGGVDEKALTKKKKKKKRRERKKKKGRIYPKVILSLALFFPLGLALQLFVRRPTRDKRRRRRRRFKGSQIANQDGARIYNIYPASTDSKACFIHIYERFFFLLLFAYLFTYLSPSIFSPVVVDVMLYYTRLA